MTSTDPSGLNWRKSSYSGGSGNECVEVAALPDGGTALRDSKNPDGGMLTLTSDQWAALYAALTNSTDLL